MADVAAPIQPVPSQPAQSMRDQMLRDLAAPATPAPTDPGAGTPTTTSAPAAPTAPVPSTAAPSTLAPDASLTPLDLDDFQFSDEREGTGASVTSEGAAAPPLPATTAPPEPTPPTPTPPALSAEDELMGHLTAEQRRAVEWDILSRPRGKMMLQSYKIMREMALPPEQGGLGRVPSVEELRAFHASHSDKLAMQNDFEAAAIEPDRLAAWTQFWFGPSDESGALRPGSLEAASLLPANLARTSPQLYQAVAAPIFHDFLNGPKGLYAAAQSASGDQRNLLLNAAQVVEYWITGKARPLDEFGIGIGADAVTASGNGADPGVAAAPPSTDPNVAALATERRLRLDLEQRLQSERTSTLQRQFDAFVHSVDSTIDPALTRYADEALQPLRAAGYPPEIYSLARGRFISSVRDLISRDRDSSRQMDAQFTRARRDFTSPGLGRQIHDGMVQFYVDRAKLAIKSTRAAFLRNMIGDASRVARAQADRLGTTNGNGAGPNGSGRTPTPSGSGSSSASAQAPTPQQLTRDVARGESQESFLQRRIMADLSGGG